VLLGVGEAEAGHTTSLREWLPLSATTMEPPAATVMPLEALKLEAEAGPLALPAVPLPARVLTEPPGVRVRSTLLLLSATMR
jgi:hypothetical protein